jgi:hypothetical protein
VQHHAAAVLLDEFERRLGDGQFVVAPDDPDVSPAPTSRSINDCSRPRGCSSPACS